MILFYQAGGLGELFGGFSFGGSGIVTLIMYMGIGLAIMAAIFGTFYYIYASRKKWFLKVEVKIPRSDGRIIQSEWAKGTYNAKKGHVLIKRKGKRASAMKPFDIKRFLQGNDTLTVIQIGIDEYRPVLPESFLEMYDEETGEEASIMKMKIDTSESRAWKESFEREAKNAYSIETIFQQYAQYIGFGILFFMIFVGFAVLWGRIQ